MRPRNWARMGCRRGTRSKRDPLSPKARSARRRQVARGWARAKLPAARPPAAGSAVPTALPGWMKGCLLRLPGGSALPLDSLMAAPRAPDRPPETRSSCCRRRRRRQLPEPKFQVPARTSQRPGRGAPPRRPFPLARAAAEPRGPRRGVEVPAAGGGSRDPRRGCGAPSPGRLHPAAEIRGDLPDALLHLKRVINKNDRDKCI